LIEYYQLFGWGNHHASSSDISEARVCVTYVTRLYDKTKGAQYASIIEEYDKARVKLLYDKTKDAHYAPIIEDNNKVGGTVAHGVQYYLNN
jgi:hypothetical protein